MGIHQIFVNGSFYKVQQCMHIWDLCDKLDMWLFHTPCPWTYDLSNKSFLLIFLHLFIATCKLFFYMNGGKKNLVINPQIVKKNEPMIDETNPKLALNWKFQMVIRPKNQKPTSIRNEEKLKQKNSVTPTQKLNPNRKFCLTNCWLNFGSHNLILLLLYELI